MAINSKTPSAVAALTNSHGQYKTRENFKNIVDALFDTVRDGAMANIRKADLMEFYTEGSMNSDQISEKTTLDPGGTIPLRADTAPLTFATTQEGFQYLWNAYFYGKAMGWPPACGQTWHRWLILLKTRCSRQRFRQVSRSVRTATVCT